MSLGHRRGDLDSSKLSTNLLTSAMHSSQTGSAYDYVKAIATLTTTIPTVWTTDYHGTGRKSAKSRLAHFLRKGSQNSSPDFWKYIEELLLNLPTEILTQDSRRSAPDSQQDDIASSFDILDSLHEGIVNRDEPRSNSEAAWHAYLQISEYVSNSINGRQRTSFFKLYLVPLLMQYVRPSQDFASWSVASPHPEHVCMRACASIFAADKTFFIDQWTNLSASIIEDLRVSHPEQSKHYNQSQDSLASETSRWYLLYHLLFRDGGGFLEDNVVCHCLHSELEAAVSVLLNRNGKPYGAAAAITNALEHLSVFLASNEAIKKLLEVFGNEQIPSLILSPAAKHVAKCLDLLQGVCDVSAGLSKSLEALTEAPESLEKIDVLRSLLSSPTIIRNEALGSHVLRALRQALDHGHANDWNLVNTAVSNPNAPKLLSDDLISSLTENLSIADQPDASLHGLELLQQYQPQRLRSYATSEHGSQLMSKLFFLTDNAEETTRKRAQALNTTLQSGISRKKGHLDIHSPSFRLIKDSFTSVTMESIP